MKHLTELHLIGYTINQGNLSSMTPLQRIVTNIITEEILKWKLDSKPFVVI